MLINDMAAIAKYGQLYMRKEIVNNGIPAMGYDALYYIRMHDGCKQEEVGQALECEKGNLARLLSKLEAQNLIIRRVNPNNRRENTLHITPEGDALWRGFEAQIVDWTNQLLSVLSAEEQTALMDMLLRLRGQAKEIVEIRNSCT